MMKTITLYVTMMAVFAATTHSANDDDWAAYKTKYGKHYSPKEDMLRRKIYDDSLKLIESHNKLHAKGLSSFYLGLNEYADMSSQEFLYTMNGYQPTEHHAQYHHKGEEKHLPSEVNWVKEGYVTPVKSQGHCASDYAFSATGSIEGAHFKHTGKLVSLSEKNLLDCAKDEQYVIHGCQGGSITGAFGYVFANKGIDTEASYPYKPEIGKTCNFTKYDVGATVSAYVLVKTGSEEHLQHAVATVGPISVGINAIYKTFQLYKGGVYDEPRCHSEYVDRAVLVVGYGTEHGLDYWLVKNSMGTGWGEDGYIRMIRNKDNRCGIANNPTYPIVV